MARLQVYNVGINASQGCVVIFRGDDVFHRSLHRYQGVSMHHIRQLRSLVCPKPCYRGRMLFVRKTNGKFLMLNYYWVLGVE